MTLREAIEQTRDHGGVVVYGDPPDWSEYSTQHFWRHGTLHWTAGGTVGGEIGEPWQEDSRFAGNLDKPGFGVYHDRT